jgi:hypothetical protein
MCSLLRFNLTNGSGGTQLFNSLTINSSGAPVLFAPSAGGVTVFQAVDAIGPFGGTGTVNAGGTRLFIDFITGSGFAFELAPGTSGYVEVPLAGTPAVTGTSFTFAASLDGGATVSGNVGVVSTVPEPATLALLVSGLAVIGGGSLVSRRRRAA